MNMVFTDPGDVIDGLDIVRQKNMARQKVWRNLPANVEKDHLSHIFVSIDSEGQNYPGEDIVLNEVRHPAHGTYLWGVSLADPAAYPSYYLHDPAAAGKHKPRLEATAILDWLLSLPEKYGYFNDRKGKNTQRARFVMFGSSYDWTQVISQLPLHKAYEIYKHKTYPRPADPSTGSGQVESKDIGRTPVFWKRYTFQYVKGKWMDLGLLADPDKHGKIFLKKDGKPSINYAQHIRIFETYGYFQEAFRDVVDGMVKHGKATAREQEIIERGKAARSGFNDWDIEDIKEYMTCETRLHALQMTEINEALVGDRADPDRLGLIE